MVILATSVPAQAERPDLDNAELRKVFMDECVKELEGDVVFAFTEKLRKPAERGTPEQYCLCMLERMKTDYSDQEWDAIVEDEGVLPSRTDMKLYEDAGTCLSARP